MCINTSHITRLTSAAAASRGQGAGPKKHQKCNKHSPNVVSAVNIQYYARAHRCVLASMDWCFELYNRCGAIERIANSFALCCCLWYSEQGDESDIANAGGYTRRLGGRGDTAIANLAHIHDINIPICACVSIPPVLFGWAVLVANVLRERTYNRTMAAR